MNRLTKTPRNTPYLVRKRGTTTVHHNATNRKGVKQIGHWTNTEDLTKVKTGSRYYDDLCKCKFLTIPAHGSVGDLSKGPHLNDPRYRSNTHWKILRRSIPQFPPIDGRDNFLSSKRRTKRRTHRGPIHLSVGDKSDHSTGPTPRSSCLDNEKQTGLKPVGPIWPLLYGVGLETRVNLPRESRGRQGTEVRRRQGEIHNNHVLKEPGKGEGDPVRQGIRNSTLWLSKEVKSERIGCRTSLGRRGVYRTSILGRNENESKI